MKMTRRDFLLTTSVATISAHAPLLRATAAGFNAFDTELASVEQNPALLVGAGGSFEAKDLTRRGIAVVASSNAPKSKTTISARAARLIVLCEVSSQKHYENKLRGAIWPRGNSGVTIAIGYDIGYVQRARFREDWTDYASATDIDNYLPACGVRGDSAKQLLATLPEIDVSWETALMQFEAEVLPRYIWETENGLLNTHLLTKDSLGALVSLVYNRGASFRIPESRDATGRYKEMREIRRLMRSKDFNAIPGQIRKMDRLWKDDPNVAGVAKRRHLEAQLFEAGLTS